MVTSFVFISMLYIILISLLVIFSIIFILPTIIFYTLFKTKYKGAIDENSIYEMVSSWMKKFSIDIGDDYLRNKESNINNGSTKMSKEEALEVLGLKPKPSPTKKEINDAYYKLIQKLHPDKGGSDYLAKKLNEAREVLVGGK